MAASQVNQTYQYSTFTYSKANQHNNQSFIEMKTHHLLRQITYAKGTGACYQHVNSLESGGMFSATFLNSELLPTGFLAFANK